MPGQRDTEFRDQAMKSLKNRPIARALSAFAMLALPALAASPNEPTSAPAFRRAAVPVADMRHARVIVKFKADSALMRESVLAARDADHVPVQHAAQLS